MFSFTFLVQALLVTAAIAVPTSKERMNDRLARRGAGDLARQGKPVNLITSQVVTTETTNTTHPEFSSNWAGAVLIAGTATYRTVTGTFTVPTPRSTGGTAQQCASAWVGIDGDTCGTAILQTGVDFCVTGTSVAFDGWYEYFPDFAHDFTGITFAAGDSITLTATASSTTAGTVSIRNNSRGTTVTRALSSSARLCEFNAEWIVEDFETCSGSSCSLVPFANFGTVVFTGASAGTSSGSTVSPSGATIIDIEQNNRVLTSVSVSGSSVTVSHT